MALRNLPRRRVTRALRSLGFEIVSGRGKGSHELIVHPTDPSRRATLPARDPVAVGTLNNILKRLVITREEFERALGD